MLLWLYSHALIGIAVLIDHFRGDVDFAVVPGDDAVEEGGVSEYGFIGEEGEGGALEGRRIEEALFAGGEGHEKHATAEGFGLRDFDALPEFPSIAYIIHNIHALHLDSK